MLSRRETLTLTRASQHASAADFCRVFHQDISILYWLALVLTSDEHKAEECFVAGLDECVKGNSVFAEWARSWCRRVVIKNAIRMVSPRPGMPNAFPKPKVYEKRGSPAQIALAALTYLQPFDRFIFVMSVLEGYADRDCATLLDCSSTDVAEARIRALRELPREPELCAAPVDESSNEPEEPAALHDADVA